MNVQISMVISGEKAYMGKVDIDELGKGDLMAVSMDEALEVREMMVPTQEGQIQRMINFTTISPFDKSTHTIIINNPTAFVKIEEGSDSVRAYENFKQQFNKVQIVGPGALNNLSSADFGGKFKP
jgi:hypothetical protein